MGIFIGVLTGIFDQGMNGAGIQTIFFTACTFVGLLLSFKLEFIKISNWFLHFTEMFASVMLTTYAGDALLSIVFLDWKPVSQSFSWSTSYRIGIAVLGGLILLVDFSLIKDVVGDRRNQQPKYMEWYCAFTTLVSFIWIYLAILFLLASARKKT